MKSEATTRQTVTEAEQYARRAKINRDRAHMDPIHRDYFIARAEQFERWAKGAK